MPEKKKESPRPNYFIIGRKKERMLHDNQKELTRHIASKNLGVLVSAKGNLLSVIYSGLLVCIKSKTSETIIRCYFNVA